MNQLIAELHGHGIVLSADGDKLNVKAKKSPVPPQLIAKLKDNKAQLLAYLQAQQKTEVVAISERQKQQGVSLSTQQLALWPLYQLSQAAIYNIPGCYDIKGNICQAQLVAALEAVYRHFDALHSRFIEADINHPQPMIYACVNEQWKVEVVDGDEQQLHALMQVERMREFDLLNDDLFVAKVVRLNAEHWALIVNFPHIITDGWSIEQLWLAIDNFYQNRTVASLAVDYLDYLHAQQERPLATASNTYWQQRLKGYENPKLHSLSSTTDVGHHTYHGLLTKQQVLQLQMFAQQRTVSVYGAALGLFAQVMCLFTGEDEVVISTPYAGREEPQLAQLVGYFAAVVPVRCMKNPDWHGFSQQLSLDFAHANGDFNRLLTDLGMQNDAGRNPLQQIVFGWQDSTSSEPRLANCKVERRESQTIEAKFPLMLTVRTGDDGYQLIWEFDSRQLSLDTVECIEKLLKQTIAANGYLNSEVLVNQLTWSHESFGQATDLSVIDVLESVVNAQSDDVAVSYGTEQLSYRQLWQRSAQIAAELSHLGVVVGDRVGVQQSRSLDFACTLVAIVMAGGVYVPFGVDESPERMATLAQLAGMNYCISDSPASISGVRCMALSELMSSPNSQQHSWQKVALGGGDGIYINFSSGTTGEPKGIECLHQGVVRLTKDVDYVDFNLDTCMLCAAPATFDAFTLEFWAPLLNGGEVCLLPHSHLGAETIVELIQKQGVNTVWLTAALFHTLVDINPQAFKGLDYLLVGGDVISPQHVQRVYQRDENITIINGYGPTENTTFTCCYRIPRDWPVDQALPIGKAINGTKIAIIDEDLHPLSHGCVGEILTSGLGLAKGYLNVEQQQGVFVELVNPQGERIRAYRTGDLGFIDSQGLVRFVGRRDAQVKVNGYRIELAAVNRVLCQLSPVDNGATVVTGKEGSQQLVSFVTLATNQGFNEAQLLAELNQHLPSYMLPSRLFLIEQLPLTPNGKVDNKTLLEVLRAEQGTDEPSQSDTRALTELESQVADIWQQVLTVSVKSPNAHFYQLGGNSLLLMKVQALLAQHYDIQLSIDVLFKHTLLSQLCAVIQSGQGQSELPSLPLQAIDVTQGIALSHEQTRLYYLHQLTPSSAYNISFVIDLNQSVSYERANWAIKSLLQQHPILTMRYGEQQGEVLQYAQALDDYQLQVKRLDEAGFEWLLECESQRVFDLACFSQVIYLLELLDDDGHIMEQKLLFNIHHIGFDGASIAVLLACLDGALTGNIVSDDNFGYEQYVYWQHGEHRVVAEQDLAYWQEQLQGIEDNTYLPADKVANQMDHNAAHYTRALNGMQVVQMQALAQRLGVTEYSLWQSVFALILGRVNDKSQVVVATPVANRSRAQFHQSIGFYANTLLVNSHWQEQPNGQRFAEYVAQNHQHITASLVHQSVSLADLVAALTIEVTPGTMPISQVLFSINHQTNVMLQGQKVRLRDGKNSTCKYDFFFSMLFDDGLADINIEYNQSLYSNGLISSFVDSLLMVVAQVTAQPEIHLHDIQLVEQAPPTPLCVKNPESRTLIDLFNQQLQQCPEQIALLNESQQYSYQQVASMSDAMAEVLASHGVKRGDTVAVYMDRDCHLPIILLAIMKVAGVYVPLDKAYPQERTEYIISHANPKLIIKSLEFVLPQPCLATTSVLLVDELLVLAADIEKRAYSSLPNGDDLAYVIYTSGSTGVPKGVAINHSSVIQLCDWAKVTYDRDDFSLVYAGTSVCFDLSVFEIFVTWSVGGGVFFANNQLSLADHLADYAISMINTVPSVFAAVMEFTKAVDSIRVINLAGEIFHADLARRIAAKFTQARIYNLYGPSEDTTYSTYYQLEDLSADTVKIGQLLPGSTGFVADRLARPLPTYFAGELYLGGAGLARGYFNQPQLTAERFIEIAGGRYFRTGDQVRLDDQKQYDYLGRIDNQVKLRGFRIEPGEIESVINGLDMVLESQVLMMKVDNEDQLVAFYKATEQAVTDSQLQQAVAERLPKYMMPYVWVSVAQFARTPSGKIDRKPLMAMNISGVTLDESGLDGELDDIAKTLLTLWSECIGSETVVNAGRFLKGGTSLMLVVLRHKIEATFGIKLALRQFYEHSNVVAFSDFIATQLAAQSAISEDGVLSAKPVAQPLTQVELEQIIAKHDAPGMRVSIYENSDFSHFTVGVSHVGENGQGDVQMHDHNRFMVVCFNKVIVSALVMVLDHQGIVDIDAPVNQICAGILQRGRPEDDHITLMHLLTHSGGFDESNMGQIQANCDSLAQFVKNMSQYGQTFTPGEGFYYSSSAGVMIAYLIEQLTNMSWQAALHHYLFEPLGIDDQYVDVPTGYVRNETNHVVATYPPENKAYFEAVVSYSIALTAEDVMKLSFFAFNNGRTFDGKTIISEQKANLMTAKQQQISGVHYLSGWAIGWLCYPMADLTGFITGSAGQETFIAFSKQQQKILVAQANFWPSLALFEELVQRLFGLELLPKKAIDPRLQLANVVGCYVSDGVRARIEHCDGQYVAHCEVKQANGQWGKTISGPIIESGMGDFYVPNENHPFHDALNFYDFDSHGKPQIARVINLVCKRVND